MLLAILKVFSGPKIRKKKKEKKKALLCVLGCYAGWAGAGAGGSQWSHAKPVPIPVPMWWPQASFKAWCRMAMPFSCLLLSRLFCFLTCFHSLRVFWRWCCCCCCCICRRSSLSSSSSSSCYCCCLVAGAALACLGGISTRSSSRRLSGDYNKCDSWDSSYDYESELLLCGCVGVTVVSECLFCESGVLACVRACVL